MCCLPDNTPAGIQGARHALFGISLSDLHLNNKLQSGLFHSSFQQLNQHSRISNEIMTGNVNRNESLSSLLTMGNSTQNLEKSDSVKLKRHQFVLFGQPILTEQQISNNGSSDTVSEVTNGKSLTDGNPEGAKFHSNGSGSLPEQQASSNTGISWLKGLQATEFGLDTGHCKVFMESEDVGRVLDLSLLGSYEELYRRLANMFGIERSEMLSHVLYHDATGAVKRTGDEPFRCCLIPSLFFLFVHHLFLPLVISCCIWLHHLYIYRTFNIFPPCSECSDFMKTAKRLTILTDSGSKSMGR